VQAPDGVNTTPLPFNSALLAVEPAAGDTLSATQNVPVQAASVTGGDTGVVMQWFRIEADANSIELSTITVDDVGSAAAGTWSALEIYIDDDSAFNDGGDPTAAVQIGQVLAWPDDGTPVALTSGTQADRTVSAGTPKYLFVVYNIDAAAVGGTTIQSRVSAVGVVAPDNGVSGLTFNSNAVLVNAAPVNGTTIGTNTATPSSCEQITVTSVFTGDDNGSGSVQVEFNNADAWGGTETVACWSVVGASPRQCLVIDGTSDGTNTIAFDPATSNNWVRVVYSDGDGVTGTNNEAIQVSVPACNRGDDAPPTVLVLAPSKGGVVSGTDKARVQIWDADGLAATNPISWWVDGGTPSTAVTENSNYNCDYDGDSTCKVWEFDINTSGLANGLHRLTVEVTDDAGNTAQVSRPFRVFNLGADAGGGGLLLRRTHGSQLCQDCHSLKTHSSQTTSTKFGNWAMECLSCHTPHATENIFLIREQIDTPNSGSRPVRFEVFDPNASGQPDEGGAVADSSGPGTASFVNEDNATQTDGPCQVCHTKTGGASARWRNADSGGHTTNTHYATGATGGTQPCTDCHSHGAGFSGAGGGGCTGCHFTGGSAVTAGRRPVDADFTKRSHHVGTATGAYLTGVLSDFDCVVCHAEGTIDAGATATTAFHNEGGCAGGEHCIDLKNVDTWVDATPAAANVYKYDKAAIAASAGAAANWNSGDQTWREWTSGVEEAGLPDLGTDPAGLDPFCLSCHDNDGAWSSYNATDGGTASNPFGDSDPFGDDVIGNDYDRWNRVSVVDIASRVAQAWTNGSPGGDWSATYRDLASEPRGEDTRYDPPEGIYSRHAIRGQSVSVYGGLDPDADGNGSWDDSTYWEGTWASNSVMGCADCHTVDGANTTAGNAHGSDSEYLLKDGAGLARLGRLSPGTGEGPYNCLRCHKAAHYDDSVSTHTGKGSDYVDTVGLVGAARVPEANSGGNLYGIACMNCHGGVRADETDASYNTPEFGTIHGTSQIYLTGENGSGTATRETYRFMNGNSLRYYDPGSWTSGASTCFTLSSGGGDEFGGCIKHGGGQTHAAADGTPQAGNRIIRELNY
jgi:hypothetical protein